MKKKNQHLLFAGLENPSARLRHNYFFPLLLSLLFPLLFPPPFSLFPSEFLFRQQHKCRLKYGKIIHFSNIRCKNKRGKRFMVQRRKLHRPTLSLLSLSRFLTWPTLPRTRPVVLLINYYIKKNTQYLRGKSCV